MRLPLLLALVALAACSAEQRRAIGGPVQAAAAKGVVLGTASQAEDAPAAKGADKAAKPNLPGTLGGDVEHRAYSSGPNN